MELGQITSAPSLERVRFSGPEATPTWRLWPRIFISSAKHIPDFRVEALFLSLHIRASENHTHKHTHTRIL